MFKINNEIVKPIPILGGKDTRLIKGVSLFPEIDSNIFLVAKEMSGKSSVIYTIVDKCPGRNTEVIAFVNTIHE